MSRFRSDIVVKIALAVLTAIVGTLVTWSIGASVKVPGWVIGLFCASFFATIGIAVWTQRRIVDMKSVKFDTEKRVYFSTSPRAVNPGPFCPKCYEVDNRRVSIVEKKDGSHYCQTCREGFYSKNYREEVTVDSEGSTWFD